MQKQRPKWISTAIIVLIAFGLGIGTGFMGTIYITAGSDEPSQDVDDAIDQLSLDDPTPTLRPETVDDLNNEISMLSTQVAEQNTQIATLSAGGNADTSGDAASADAENALPERALFAIDQEQSEARFRLFERTSTDEEVEVIGRTSDVGGTIIINYQNPAQSSIGQIGINARTLRTPNDERNASIRSQILETREHEFIFFNDPQILNLTNTPVEIGSTVEFQVVGELEIKEVAREVTFDVTLTADAIDQISGFASVGVNYADWGITINAPPFIPSIDETVVLEIEFTAILTDSE